MASSSSMAFASAAEEAQKHGDLCNYTHGLPRPCQAAAAPKMMQVVKVAGDGDCLFHSLAHVDGSNGGALRIDVADFMEAHASEQDGFEEAWFREANKLRASAWGGHTAIIAFSLLKNLRVKVHTWQDETGTVMVEEVSHASIFGRDTIQVVDILYNGKDHYDALIEIADFTGMVLAWPQLPPPRYFSQAGDEFPPLSASTQTSGRSKANGFNAPRPPKKGKCKAKGNEGNAEAEASLSTTPATQKEDQDEADDDNQPGIMDALQKVPVAESSPHPHKQVEDLIKDRRWGNMRNAT